MSDLPPNIAAVVEILARARARRLEGGIKQERADDGSPTRDKPPAKAA